MTLKTELSRLWFFSIGLTVFFKNILFLLYAVLFYLAISLVRGVGIRLGSFHLLPCA